MDASRAAALAEIIYEESNGYLLSKSGKELAGLESDKAFTYGEISFATFPEILETALLGSTEPGIFYDLGSGTGKAVIMAALSGKFKRVVGIELLPELHQEAERVHTMFARIVAPLMATEEPVPEISFINSDFFLHDWSDASCIFVQGTCMPSDIIKQLTKKFEEAKPNTRFIVASTLLPTDVLVLQSEKTLRLGWGQATIYFYKKP